MGPHSNCFFFQQVNWVSVQAVGYMNLSRTMAMAEELKLIMSMNVPYKKLKLS